MVIIGFLVIFPLVIGITSIVGIPDTEYEYAIYEPGTSSYSELTFYPSMEELTASLDEDIPFNAKLIIRANESFLLDSPNGISGSNVRSRLKPHDFSYSERHLMNDHYDYQSFGYYDESMTYWHYTIIDFNELNLIPGTFKIENNYYATSGLFWKGQPAQTTCFKLGKDSLRIIPEGPFPQDHKTFQYNVIYTFDEGDHWKVIFNGRIVNSLNESVSVDNLELAIETNNQYETIATISTEANGSFHYTHVIYSPSLNTNAMARIKWKQGNRYYRPFTHSEYAGLELPIEGDRFFRDLDQDGWPEWPFDLYDLINGINTPPPPPETQFWSRFHEGFGQYTYDYLNNKEGELMGNTMWIPGIRDNALSFNKNYTMPDVITDDNAPDYTTFGMWFLEDIFAKTNNEYNTND